MATVEATLNIARSRLGYREGAGNNTPFGAWSGAQNAPWCASYLSWVLDQAGIGIGKIVYCPTLVNYFKRSNALFANPQVGDVFVMWFPRLGRYAHTGFVEAVDGGYVRTIEGNTDLAGSRTGGSVLRKRRRWRGTKNVFGRPAYSAAAPSAPAPRAFGLNPPAVMRPIVAEYAVGDGFRMVAENGDAYNWFGAPYEGPEPGRRDHDPVSYEPIVDAKADPNGPGGWLLAASGAVYALGAPFHGGVNDKAYFRGFVAAHLEIRDDGKYRIQATDPGTGGYDPPF